MQKRTFLRICFAIYLAVLVLWTPPSSTEGIQNSTKCNSLCFHPPEFFLLSSLSNIKGAVVIGGVNFNAPTDDPKMVRLALQGSNFSPVITGSLGEFNRQFTAAQLGLNSVGGSPVATNVLWSPLSCYGFTATITLSNGAVLSPQSMVKDLFMQARNVATGSINSGTDVGVITSIIKRLNGGGINGTCGGVVGAGTYCCQSLEAIS